MSAPIIWIIFPLLVSIGLIGLRQHPRLLRIFGFAISGLLSIFALFQPIGNVFKLGSLAIDILPNLNFLGRSFLIENSDRFTLVLIYATLSFFIGGVGVTNQLPKFIPLGFAISALFTAALSVQPFLYSAVLIELAVLLMIPLVTVKGVIPDIGISRFLIYVSLAMPFILFAGWVLGGTEASLSDEVWRSTAAIFLGIGFALWLAIFPFHSWVPQLAQSIHPHTASFIFSLLPVTTLLTMLKFTSSLVWLREAGYLSPAFLAVGIIMIVTSGIWAAVENNLKRILAYSVLFETGFAMLLIGLQTNQSVPILYQSFIPRILGLAVLGLSLSVIGASDNLYTVQGLKSSVRRFPFASASLLISLFSIAGLPLFAGFPIKYGILHMIGITGVSSVVWVLVGMGSFLVAVVRIFSRATYPSKEKWEINETIPQIIYLCGGIIALTLLGWFPQIIRTVIGHLLINLPVLQ